MSDNGEAPQPPEQLPSSRRSVPLGVVFLVGVGIMTIAFLAKGLTGAARDWLLDVADGNRFRAWLIGSAFLAVIAVAGWRLGWWGSRHGRQYPGGRSDHEGDGDAD